MTTLFRGGEMDAFLPADGNCYESAASGRYNASFARCALYLIGSTTYAQSASWGNETDVWVHTDINIESTASGTFQAITLYDASGTETANVSVTRYAIGSGYGYRVKLFYRSSGGTMTELGTSSFDITIDALHTLDLHVDYSASGSMTIYSSGTERHTGSVDLSHLSGADHLRLGGSLKTYYSQVIVKDESTIGRRILTCPPTGPGSSTAWVGDYSRVDEVKYSDADFINSSTAAQDELFVHSTSIPTGYVIAGVTVSNRGKKGSTGPANHRQLLRVSGTTYASGSDIALDLGYEPYQTHWDQDPSTTADWLNSTGSTLQFGARSAT